MLEMSVIGFAEYEFRRAMDDPNNLIAIHKLSLGTGRRRREVSLNRAVVVLTVAAWQAYLEALVNQILDPMAIPSGAQGHERFRIVKMNATKAAYNFSTPNAKNTRRLLMHLDFDPWPHWAWEERDVRLDTAAVRDRMNAWLLVRHAIAHGHPELPDVDVLTSLPGGRRSLRRGNAEACMEFFQRVVSCTTQAASDKFE